MGQVRRSAESRLPGGDKPNMPVPAPYSKNQMLKHEADTLGFFLSVHPLDRCEEILKGLNYVKARDLHAQVDKQVTTIGYILPWSQTNAPATQN